jgi:Xaa-Pro aminopeptidase
MNSAAIGFNSIVAAGANAATLHYEALAAKIRKEDMVLIDSGAQLNRYCADITRVLPASGMFSQIHRIIYEIVLQAQLAALKKVKAGVKILTIYDAAAEVITEGLKELGVLKGPLKALLKKKAFKPYFPHGIGHSLGLDVHDLSQLRGNNEAVLEAGMVFTIEPGLYFSKSISNVPACGVRIEDNVLVTKSGCEILSPGFPKDAEQIEALMQSYAAD